MHRIGRQWCQWGTTALVALVAMTGCNKLLEVNLPSAIAKEDVDVPTSSQLRVNSVLAQFECAYSSFTLASGGYEDNFERYTGVAGLYSEYQSTPTTASCDTDTYSYAWLYPLLTVRLQGYDSYSAITGYAGVANKDKLLAEISLYTAISLEVFGEHMCDFTISTYDDAAGTVDYGDPMTPLQTLAVADGWIDSTFNHITAAGGDFGIKVTQGTITSSIQTMAYGIRARILLAAGDTAGAAAAAANVPNDFMAYVLREDGEKRRNMVSSMQGGGGGTQAAGFLQGAIRLKTSSNGYGVSSLGTNPANGDAQWPDSIPFTGYLNLAIDSEGRAVMSDGYPITTLNTAGATADSRITYEIGNTAGGLDNIPTKYPNLADDMPLVNWREMRLIEAADAGPSPAGVAFVNEIRTADGLPTITGGYATTLASDATEYRYMLIEETRRALWLEGRFWSTKTENTDLLWFPRFDGNWINSASQYVLYGGVRVLMSNDEYNLNPKFTGGLADRGTGCASMPGSQVPVF